MTVLFLLVAYNNHEQVDAFIASASAMLGEAVAFAVCDNSPRDFGWQPRFCPPSVFVSRPDNPGYLEGALLGLDQYLSIADHPPDWVFISNTDLTLLTSDIVRVLNERHDPSAPSIVAPRITEAPDGREMNPHLITERPHWRHRVNRLLTSRTWMAYLYLVASKLCRDRHTRERRTPWCDFDRMYAPHGAMVGLSRGFLEAVALPRNVPLLAEEFVLAEAARRAGALVRFEPRIHVCHHPHSTTGSAISWSRARLLARAFRFIDSYAYAEDHAMRGD